MMILLPFFNKFDSGNLIINFKKDTITRQLKSEKNK